MPLKKNHYPPLRAAVHRKQPVLSERPIRNTHVQPPHPFCAGGTGWETERVGWGGRTKEIVREETCGREQNIGAETETGERRRKSVKKTKQQRPSLPAGPLHRHRIQPQITNSPPSRHSRHFSPCKYLFVTNASNRRWSQRRARIRKSLLGSFRCELTAGAADKQTCTDVIRPIPPNWVGFLWLGAEGREEAFVNEAHWSGRLGVSLRWALIYLLLGGCYLQAASPQAR